MRSKAFSSDPGTDPAWNTVIVVISSPSPPSYFFSALAFASLILKRRTELYQIVRTNRERKIFQPRIPKVTGIWMKLLSLQGFTAGSFVSSLFELFV